MKKLIKWAAAGVGLLIVLLVLASLAAWVWFDEAKAKSWLTTQVKNKTQHELTISGEMSLKLFPKLGLSVGASQLRAPDNAQPLIEFEQAFAELNWLPLFKKQAHIEQIHLDKPSILVATNEANTNWQTFVDAAKPSRMPTNEESGWSVKLDGIEVTDGALSWQTPEQTLTLSQFNLAIEQLDPTQATPLTLSFTMSHPPHQTSLSLNTKLAPLDLQTAQPQIQLSDFDSTIKTTLFGLTGSFKAGRIEANKQTVSLQSMDWQGTLESPLDTARRVPLATQAEAGTVNIAQRTLSMPTLSGQLANINYSGDLSLDLKTLIAKGNIQANAFELGPLLKTFGLTPESLSQTKPMLDLKGQYQVKPYVLNLPEIKGNFDDTPFSGRFYYDHQEPAINMTAKLGALNLDRYLSANKPNTQSGDASGDASSLFPEHPWFKQIDSAIDLTFDQVTVTNITSTDGSVLIKSTNGNWTVEPKAQLYGGRYEGNLTLILNESKLGMNERFNNINVGQFAQDLFGNSTLNGQLTGHIRAASQGQSPKQLQSKLSGQAEFELIDGIWQSMNIDHEIKNAIANIMKNEAPATPAKPYTTFNALKGQTNIQNGVATISDTVVRTDLLRMQTQGKINLIDQTLDLSIRARFLDTKDLPASLTRWLGFPIELHIQGPITAPEIDKKALVKELATLWLKVKLAEGIGIKPNADLINKEKEDLNQQLNDRKEELKDKVDDKAKDLLKDLLK